MPETVAIKPRERDAILQALRAGVVPSLASSTSRSDAPAKSRR